MVHFPRFACLLVLLCTSGALVGCRREAAQSLYLLPNHFVGNVLLVFDQPAGAPPEYRGSARLYRIPANGVLRTQFKPNYGMHQPDHYYYVTSDGKTIKELPYFNKVQDAPATYQLADTICLHALPFKDAKTQKVNYMSLIVGRMSDSESLHEERENTLRRFR